jgi:hypothetical protein
MPAIALAGPWCERCVMAHSIGKGMQFAMVAWLTHGAFTPAARDVQVMRIVILTVMPAAVGLLLGLAVRLWRSR